MPKELNRPSTKKASTSKPSAETKSNGGPAKKNGTGITHLPNNDAFASNDSAQDPLTEFRTLWLRALAKAWLKNQEKQLEKDPKGYMAGWPESWNRLDLKLHREAEFLWVGDSWSWLDPTATSAPKGSIEDELLIYLPLTAKIEEPELAIALAKYYESRPSIFSRSEQPTPSRTAWATRTAKSVVFHEASLGRVIFPPQGPNPNGLWPNVTDFSSFSVALMTALARAWTDKNFRRRLEQDPNSTLARDFTNPWKMNIRIKDDPKVTWRSDPQTPENGSWNFDNEKNNVLRLCLPEKPESGRNQVLALAAYNATGAEYPFSCCP